MGVMNNDVHIHEILYIVSNKVNIFLKQKN